MLKIYYGELDNAIYNTSVYFNNSYLNKWITDDFAIKVIKSIDKSTVINSETIKNKYLGTVPITQLSGGTKTLLLIKNEKDKIFNASTCGDNCAKYILEIANNSKKDITINLYHIMDFGKKRFNIEIINSSTVVHNMEELVKESYKYV